MKGRTVVPVLHPSFIVRGGWVWRGTTVRDLMHAVSAERPAKTAYDPDWSPDRLPVSEVGPVAVDLETIRGTHKITQINLSWAPAMAVAAPWSPLIEKAVMGLLCGDRLKIFHNASFDIGKLRENGITVGGPEFDTMIAAAILEPDLPNNLEHVAKDYTDIQPWKHLSQTDLGVYGCIDADATYRIYKEALSELRLEGVEGVFETSMKVAPLLRDMHEVGLRIDAAFMEKKRDECVRKEAVSVGVLDEMVEKLEPRRVAISVLTGDLEARERAQETAVRPIDRRKAINDAKKIQKAIEALRHPNWASQKQLLTVLDDMGLSRKTDHKTGRTTTDAAAIQEIARQTKNPVLIKLLDYRSAQKLRSTYFEQAIAADGRIHPQYLLHRDYDIEGGQEGACSGRLASKGPNIQNWPKTARGIVVPDFDGWEWMEADYKQIEFMVIAWKTGGRLWKDVTTAGFDIHKRVAAEVYGIPLKDVTKEQRDEGKRCVYAGAYGVGALTLSRRLAAKGIFMDVREAKRFIETFKKIYPEIIRTQNGWVKEAMGTNRVRNPFGRYRRFWNPSNEVTEIYNFYPQSTAGDIILRAMALVGRQLPRPARMAIQVHDSLVVGYPKELRKEVGECLTECMTALIPEMAGFRPMVELKHGLSWEPLETLDLETC